MGKKVKGDLGKLELEVMHVVWEKGEASVREVLKVINKKKDLAYTTIMTTMKNLELKGYLAHREEERVFIYKPVFKKEDIESSMLRNLVNSVFKGSYKQLVNRLVLDDSISKDQVKEILDIIDSEGKSVKKEQVKGRSSE